MRKTRGHQYGNMGVLSLALVLPVAVVFSLLSALGNLSPAVPIGASVGMLVLAVWIRQTSLVTVDDSGVAIRFFGGGLSFPWNDIEGFDERRLSARIVRKSSGKRVFVAMLDPGWRSRPVAVAIRTKLSSLTVA